MHIITEMSMICSIPHKAHIASFTGRLTFRELQFVNSTSCINGDITIQFGTLINHYAQLNTVALE
jgi:hypothetical protein